MPRCRAGLFVLLALGVATASAQANLLVNGGGEGDVGGNGFTNVPPSGWQLTGAPTVTQHGSFGPGYFGTSDPGVAVRGQNYIGGGEGQAVSTLTQTIDVSAEGEAIDAGTTPFTLCGYLGGFSIQNDAAAVTVTFE